MYIMEALPVTKLICIYLFLRYWKYIIEQTETEKENQRNVVTLAKCNPKKHKLYKKPT